MRLVQFIGVVLFSLACASFPTCRRFLILLPAAPRWFQRNDGEERAPRRVLSILCIVEQLRPTLRMRAICEYTLPPSLPIPRSTYSAVYPFPPALPSLHFTLFLAFSSPLPLPAPVAAARTSFRAPWGCKYIRDDGRVLPE